MESEESSRPSLGFPSGLALLLVILFLMSGFFTCCLHWDKIRSLFRITSSEENSHAQQDIEHLPQKPTPAPQESKENKAEPLPVLMPGDQVPRFIAMACPCEPPLLEKMITIKVQKPPPVPIPLYL
ncbi:hypothetical protein P3X46_021186 [Hevea brasiliensis]|uniref:Hydroxyproline-rich glycoprotein family protein n=1 Tax=Hevea brasiliensis TaxID=3981 RepID=A0ABQ9LFX0_HEVBR|nr:uncharacterized protein At5g65660 [Hevea brasiliensis]KAJ9166428.1 hypothetical protein P3X46_021186 [Hevea brasiliensis]